MIISKTPFRISFAGGMTDLGDFYEKERGAVLSATINRYIYVCLNRRFEGSTRLCYSKEEIVDSIREIKNDRIRECLSLLGEKPSVDMASIADLPGATGLGSSSSFVVGLLNAVTAFKGRYIEKDELAERACDIEINKIGEYIGKQDQYAVSFGGLNIIEFNQGGTVSVKPVLCPLEVKDELNGSLMLMYVGQRKETASEIIEKCNIKKNRKTLCEMREIAYDMAERLQTFGILSDVGLLLDEAWQLKKSLSPGISTSKVDEIYEKAKKNGAIGGKLLGAGGGGFLLLFVEKHNRQRVREALWPIQEIAFRFDPDGSRIIYVG